MNFEEMQMIWNTQKDERLYAIDETAMRRLVERDAFVIARDLKGLEVGAICVLFGLGVLTLFDTFFNGNEYFQLVSVAVEFFAGGCLWLRRNKRESGTKLEPTSLLEHVETGIKRARFTIHRGRDLAWFFALFVCYGVAIRMMIYGWRGSEAKFVLGILGVVFVFVVFKWSELNTHRPRIRNLEALRSKLLDE